MDVSFRIAGTQAADKMLERVEKGLVEVSSLRMFVGSRDPRARWFERGFHPRGGKTLVPGRHMLERAGQSNTAGLAETIAKALDHGEDTYRLALERGKRIASAAGVAAPQGSRPTRLKGMKRLRDEYLVRTGRR